MSLRLLCASMTLLLLNCCATASREAPRFACVPLPVWTYGDQVKSAALIEAACGKEPHCPEAAYLERAVIGYVKLRETVKASCKP